MDVSAISPSVPQFTTDLRPSADAAASQRQTRPAPAIVVGPVVTVTPPSPTQAAAVSRAILIGTATETATAPATSLTAPDPSERRLVPFGIFMLPEEKDPDESPGLPAETKEKVKIEAEDTAVPKAEEEDTVTEARPEQTAKEPDGVAEEASVAKPGTVPARDEGAKALALTEKAPAVAG
jgi:hypothetical protein